MEWIKVDSSNLDAVAFENVKTSETMGNLFVRFNTGKEYRYDNVPREVYDKLLAAESKGKFFHAHIRNAGFTYAKLN